VIPVARNVWQQISAAIPADAARRRIIRQASGWLIAFADNMVPLWPREVRDGSPRTQADIPTASQAD
jgi:hypothetical protein